MTLDEILDFEMQENDAGAETLRDYFFKLLDTLWDEGEGFSGKRPFGNSGWEYEIYTALVKMGAVKGTLDEDGYIEDVDTKEANKLVEELIYHIFYDS